MIMDTKTKNNGSDATTPGADSALSASPGSHHVRLNITLDPEVARKSKIIAKETSRSFSGLIDLCLRRMITQVEKGGSISLENNKSTNAEGNGE